MPCGNKMSHKKGYGAYISAQSTIQRKPSAIRAESFENLSIFKCYGCGGWHWGHQSGPIEREENLLVGEWL